MNAQWSQDQHGLQLVPTGFEDLPPNVYRIDVDPSFGMRIAPTKFPSFLDFKDSLVDEIIDEIKVFWSKKELYAKYGMPHRRGILMYGPPGTGKSTTVYKVAKSVIDDGGIALLFPSKTYFFEMAYSQVRQKHPSMPVLDIMEDLDVIECNNSLSVLTNCIDGVGSYNMKNTCFLATTNFLNRIPASLTKRPSRFDTVVEVSETSEAGRRAYLHSLLRGEEFPHDFDKFVVDTKGLTYAHLKEAFLSLVIFGRSYEQTFQKIEANKAIIVDED